MKKKKAMQQDLDEISVADAKKVGRALYNYRLTQLWLQLRLDKDWGIKIHTSQLAEVLGGKRALGPKTRLVILCSQQIVAQYEEFYGYRKKKEESENDGS